MISNKKLLIVTGLSGAGKHQVLYQLEDLGYFCIDNLPAPLINQTVRMAKISGMKIPRLAIGVDVRTRIFLEDLKKTFNRFLKHKIPYSIIFLDAREEELVRRFVETRRPHPERSKKTLPERIRCERQQLLWLKEQADLIVDTTNYTPPELRRQLEGWLNENRRDMEITLSSFGYKYGLPEDADFVFDMRFLPNPFYVAALKPQDGNSEAVKKYVLRCPEAHKTLDLIAMYIQQVLPKFRREGKSNLHIAFGCTGGQHRSVVMANELKRRLSINAVLIHRELRKKVRRKYA